MWMDGWETERKIMKGGDLGGVVEGERVINECVGFILRLI